MNYTFGDSGGSVEVEGDGAVFGWFAAIDAEILVDGVEDEFFFVFGD